MPLQLDKISNPESTLDAITGLEKGLSDLSSLLLSSKSAVSSGSAAVLGLRTRVISCTALYTDVHLCAGKAFIRRLKDLVNNYCDLSFEDFLEDIGNISREAAKYAEQAQLVADLHTQLQIDVNDLGSDALVLQDQLARQAR